MTAQPIALKIERAVPADEATQGLLPDAPEADATAPAQAPAAARKFNFRKLLMAGAAVAVLAGAVWYGWDYWTVGRYLVSTDDAYVKADNTTIAPKVSGYLREVLVGDNERVKAGQVLARIDERDFKVALDQARADVAAAQRRDRQQAGPARRSAGGDRCGAGDHRGRSGHASPSPRRRTSATPIWPRPVTAACRTRSRRSRAIAGAQAAIARDTANLASAREADRPAQGRDRPGQCGAGARRGRAEPGRAQSRLHHDHRADRRRGRQPHAAHRPVRAGRHATDVGGAGVRRLCGGELQGNAAHRRARRPERSISPSTCSPGKIVHGHVDSIAPASGQEFALLPPDNATGNFTKVVQRIPVKIALDRRQQLSSNCVPGMSVIPTIETRARSRAAARRRPPPEK